MAHERMLLSAVDHLLTAGIGWLAGVSQPAQAMMHLLGSIHQCVMMCHMPWQLWLPLLLHVTYPGGGADSRIQSLIQVMLCSFMKVGTMVFLCHDVNDVSLELAKMMGYIERKRLSTTVFIWFMLTWFASRMFYFPCYIIRSVWSEPIEVRQHKPANQLALGWNDSCSRHSQVDDVCAHPICSLCLSACSEMTYDI